MSKGNYSCNRAVIFEVVLFFCYLYFGTTASQQPQLHLNNHNRISTTTPPPPQRQPRHLLAISTTSHQTSPQRKHHLLNNISTMTTTSPHHLRHNEQHLTFISTNAAILLPATASSTNNIAADRREGSLLGREPMIPATSAWLMISPTSVHVCASRRDRIKITKRAEPAGGEG